jgi:hypothetical protein
MAQMKGELFGLQVLVMQSLCFIAAHTEDPVRHLKGIRDTAVAGIAAEPKEDIQPRHLRVFQDAAIDVVLRCVETAQGVMAQDRVRGARPGEVSDGD